MSLEKSLDEGARNDKKDLRKVLDTTDAATTNPVRSVIYLRLRAPGDAKIGRTLANADM